MFGNGISGCRIWLANEVTVRKESASAEYNDRLRRQVAKQRTFAKMNVDGVRAPFVKGFCDSGELSYFDMEFVPGQTPYELFTYCDGQAVKVLERKILGYLRYIEGVGRKCDGAEFRLKTSEKIAALMGATAHAGFAAYLAEKASSAGFSIVKSFCHGDLTLSNMICMNGDLYLIDFLDSFIDSPMVDLAKLKQDLFYDWTLDNHVDCSTAQRLRIRQVCRRIWRTLEREMSFWMESDEFRIIEALNFLRIEPYIRGEKMRLKLDEIIKKLPIYEEFNSANGRKVD